MSSAPIFVDVAKGTPLDHLVLGVKEDCVPGSHETIAIRQFLADYHTKGNVQRVD